jgi:hypothetical protein
MNEIVGYFFSIRFKDENVYVASRSLAKVTEAYKFYKEHDLSGFKITRFNVGSAIDKDLDYGEVRDCFNVDYIIEV